MDSSLKIVVPTHLLNHPEMGNNGKVGDSNSVNDNSVLEYVIITSLIDPHYYNNKIIRTFAFCSFVVSFIILSALLFKIGL